MSTIHTVVFDLDFGNYIDECVEAVREANYLVFESSEEAYLNMQEMVIEMEAKMEKMTLDISKMARERACEVEKQIDKLTLANISTKTLEKLVKMAQKELERRV